MKSSRNISKRTLGIILFLIGIVIGYFYIYLPVLQASHGESYVSYSEKIVLLTPTIILVGLYWIVFGDKDLAKILPDSIMALFIIIGGAIALAIVFGTLFWVRYTMKSFGYS